MELNHNDDDVNLTKFISLDDFQKYARSHLDKAVYEYIASGSDDEQTLLENLMAFKRFFIIPRFLRDMSEVDMSLTLFGNKFSMPIFISPAGVQKICNDQGELATARACGKMNIIMAVSQHANTSLEDIANIAPEVPKWYQLYILKNRTLTKKILRRAVRAGYSAICLTVDSVRFGYREADARNGFIGLPENLSLPNYPTTEGYGDRKREAWDQNIETIFDEKCNWSEVNWIKSETGGLPVIIKGILSPHDAILAVRAGADGIIVSNHGGRALDGCISAIDAMGLVVRAVLDECYRTNRPNIPVFMDGGVRRGTDVLKAVAMGATAVFLGRPVFFALATDGENGVLHMLNIIRREFETAMILSGCKNLGDIKPELIIQKPSYIFQRAHL